MSYCFTLIEDQAIEIKVCVQEQFESCIEGLTSHHQQWVKSSGFCFKSGHFLMLPGQSGKVDLIIACIADTDDVATTASLARSLPAGQYRLKFESTLQPQQWFNHCLFWGLGCYRFLRYKGSDLNSDLSVLVLNDSDIRQLLEDALDSLYMGQDLINTPTEDLNPQHLKEVCQSIAEQFEASIEIIEGDALIDKGFPLIHAVGRASDNPPCLIDLRWGNPDNPSVTLVGKGVCYDTGGLSLKPTSNMKSMKKDMGGAASTLALARLIMAQGMDVHLRLLIPAVENSVSGNSYRPGDVFVSRQGLSVEITNTDAEGRLILADALTYAQEENQTPDYLFNFATLTGAARVALGADVTPVFANKDEDAVLLASDAALYGEDVWPMPIYKPYRSLLNSDVADISNSANTGFGGAITAALFLQQFVNPSVRWWHFDVFCSISQNWPGLGKGARLPVLLTVFEFLQKEVVSLKSKEEVTA